MFGTGSSAETLAFNWAAGNLQLPLLSGTSIIVAQGDLSKSFSRAGTYSAASQSASGTLSIAGTASGSIHGTVDASLVPQQYSGATLHVAGNWSC
ncbi:MAG: hypothetical protein M3063_17240 [Actinomycetota bacterium]|nr:hypothetical protein [Actinomycetota bacterium]